MAEVVAKQGETFLLRASAGGGARECASPTCPREPDERDRVYAYWFSEDPGVLPPAGTSWYCSQVCWELDQSGPKSIGRPRAWGERFPAGQYEP